MWEEVENVENVGNVENVENECDWMGMGGASRMVGMTSAG
jgi:hypothetical protein